jgi:hypothetical protein
MYLDKHFFNKKKIDDNHMTLHNWIQLGTKTSLILQKYQAYLKRSFGTFQSGLKLLKVITLKYESKGT